jgi:polyhydroxyalkanoate synthesis regulator phasin
MADIQKRIATLEERLRELKARQQRQEARRQRLEAHRSRKADTRRKILVGAVVLAKVDRGDLSESELKKWLDEALKRADDRALFGLAVTS